MNAIIDGPASDALNHGTPGSLVEFWPRHIAVELSAFLLLNPELPVQPWFERRVGQRTLELATAALR